MATFLTKIQKNASSFKTNIKDHMALIDEMRSLEKRTVEKSEQRKPRFRERGQLTPRERLSALLDPGLPFLELFNFAGYLVDDQNPDTSYPGANMIMGVGFINGARCFIWVDDSGINAGATTTQSMEKGLAGITMAKRQKLPFVHLVESAGANLMAYTVELWAKGGGLFSGLAELSAMGIPIITVLHGPSTAGGAYQPGLSDYVVGIKNNGMAALAGAALVKAATGEVSSDRELGGSEMHSQTTGLVEYLAEDDRHGIEIAREIVNSLDWKTGISCSREGEWIEPLHSADELIGVVPVDYKKPYDVREVICRLVDGSDFMDFKPNYGISTVCVHANIMGHSCGLIGNNGPIDPNGATKAAHFFQLCDQAGKPIIFLNNTTGYMVGKKYEQAGMIKHGSKMIQAVTNVRVPKITFYIGASFGAGNYGMCGFAYKPDFLFSWPNSKTGVMGGEQAALTMEEVTVNAARRRGNEIDPKILRKQKRELTNHFDKQTEAFYTSGRLLDHGIIDPRDTRKVIGFCLDTCWESNRRLLKSNSFGIARM